MSRMTFWESLLLFLNPPLDNWCVVSQYSERRIFLQKDVAYCSASNNNFIKTIVVIKPIHIK